MSSKLKSPCRSYIYIYVMYILYVRASQRVSSVLSLLYIYELILYIPTQIWFRPAHIDTHTPRRSYLWLRTLHLSHVPRKTQIEANGDCVCHSFGYIWVGGGRGLTVRCGCVRDQNTQNMGGFLRRTGDVVDVPAVQITINERSSSFIYTPRVYLSMSYIYIYILHMCGKTFGYTKPYPRAWLTILYRANDDDADRGVDCIVAGYIDTGRNTPCTTWKTKKKWVPREGECTFMWRLCMYISYIYAYYYIMYTCVFLVQRGRCDGRRRISIKHITCAHARVYQLLFILLCVLLFTRDLIFFFFFESNANNRYGVFDRMRWLWRWGVVMEWSPSYLFFFRVIFFLGNVGKSSWRRADEYLLFSSRVYTS